MFDGTFFNFLTKNSADTNKDNRFDIDDHGHDIAGNVRNTSEQLHNPASLNMASSFNAGNLY